MVGWGEGSKREPAWVGPAPWEGPCHSSEALWVRCPPIGPRGWRSRRQMGCVVGTQGNEPGNLLQGHQAPRHPQGGLQGSCLVV